MYQQFKTLSEIFHRYFENAKKWPYASIANQRTAFVIKGQQQFLVVSFRKHSDEKKENNAIITSTARASSVFLSNFSINLLTGLSQMPYADWLCYSLFKQQSVSAEELSAVSCPAEIRCSENNYLPEKRSFKGKYASFNNMLLLGIFEVSEKNLDEVFNC